MVLAVLALAAGSALAVWGGGEDGSGTLTAVVTIDGREAEDTQITIPTELIVRETT